MSLSADASALAISTPYYPTGDDDDDDDSSSPGQVRVLQWENDQWNPMGSPLTGPPGSRFGESVALDATGSTLVIGAYMQDGNNGQLLYAGAVFVYRFNNNNGEWEPQGQVIRGTLPCTFTGYSVSISGDATRIVVASPYNQGIRADCTSLVGQDIPHTTVYDLDGDTWVQVGNRIDGSEWGSSIVALSRDGETLSINTAQGLTTVFRQDDTTGEWEPQTTISTEIGEYYTRGAALNADGTQVAVAGKLMENGAAYVQLLRELDTGGEWVPIGQTIVDEEECCSWYTYENSVAMSDSGHVLVFGNQGFGQDGQSAFVGSAHVYVFSEATASWELSGSFFGELIRDEPFSQYEVWFGYSTAVSADGRTIAIGAPNHAYVEVYDYM